MVPNDWFELFASALLGMSAVTCATLLGAGWRRRHQVLGRQVAAAALDATPPGFGFSVGRTPFAGALLDVGAGMREVLERLAPQAARSLVQFDMAVEPDLALRTDPNALRAMLSDIVGNALRNAPCGRVLLTATRLGGRVHIAVSDDGAGTAAAVQEAGLREAEQLAALQGGTIQVQAVPGEGTTVVVRLPALQNQDRPRHPAQAAPAPEWRSVPARARQAAGDQSWDI